MTRGTRRRTNLCCEGRPLYTVLILLENYRQYVCRRSTPDNTRDKQLKKIGLAHEQADQVSGLRLYSISIRKGQYVEVFAGCLQRGNPAHCQCDGQIEACLDATTIFRIHCGGKLHSIESMPPVRIIDTTIKEATPNQDWRCCIF